MPLYSWYAPFGMLTYSASPSHAQRIYESMVRDQGGEAGFAANGEQAARLYAMAMGLASIQYALEHAGYQDQPLHLLECLEDREREYQITPLPTDSLPARRAMVAARMMIAGGASLANVSQALQTMLGSAFVAYHPIKGTEGGCSPATIAASPGTFKLSTTEIKIWSLVNPISVGLPAPQYATVDLVFGGSDPILIGEWVTIDPGAWGLVESCRVTDSVVVSTTRSRIQIAPWKAHSAGTLITTAPHPLWVSTYRHNLIALDATHVADSVTRKAVGDFLNRVLRIVSTWSIVEETSPGVCGPFKVGVGRIGMTTIGAITL